MTGGKIEKCYVQENSFFVKNDSILEVRQEV